MEKNAGQFCDDELSAIANPGHGCSAETFHSFLKGGSVLIRIIVSEQVSPTVREFLPSGFLFSLEDTDVRPRDALRCISAHIHERWIDSSFEEVPERRVRHRCPSSHWE